MQRSRIAYGCIVALGTIATAGMAEIEIHGKVFSKWIKSFSETIKAGMVNALPQQQQSGPVTSETIFYPFTFVGSEVAKISKSVWPFFSELPSTLKLLQASWKEVFGSIWNLISNLVDREIFSKIFDNIHTKIWNITSFFLSGSGNGERDKFIGLFKGDKMTSTFSVLGFLLGQEIGKSKYFKAKPNVFNYLLLSWMDKPKEVTKKIEKFSTTIKNLSEKLNGSNGGSSPYELDIPTVKEYLETSEELGETLFEVFWPLEVRSTIKNGSQKNDQQRSWLSLSQFLF
ncbi:hypothetical protein DNK47_00755 [Mycoplasma wenyonii]|uniref:Uncharacterized protein n=1 Tax=Mycoplasma wenyonii TaxID=65123 RepID=A0A328PNS2_9MOLU|nr:hypothetical protein DNK47_00755 [Mycoplasma wenyonii]